MDFENDIENSLKVINAAGLILYPTDTIWGIGCDATDSEAIKKVYALKNREEKKSLIILVDSIAMLEKYVDNPSPELLSFIATAQKPTTAIFKNAINLPSVLINEDGSIAVRIPKDDFCVSLVQEFKKPLVSTSANISGKPSPQNFYEVSDKIKSGVDYIVQHRQHDISKKLPSAIIKLNDKQEVEFIRR
ncbi:MAG: L-threonylcarbamoyladenylate synthase [Ginsengibacter sp.]